MKKLSVLFLLLTAIIIYSCNKNKPATEADLSNNVTLDLPATTAQYYLTLDSEINEMATLGRVLFYDGRLSANNAISCASCHKQQFAFADNAQFSRGFENRLTGRNSPAIQNIIGSSRIFPLRSGEDLKNMHVDLFWDGRENNLIDLVARPITNHVEMGIDDPETVVNKLAALPYYKELFKKAYGDENITFSRVAEAIALFIGAINSDTTRFERALNGEAQLSALEQHGFNLFLNTYECINCHNPTPYHGGGEFFSIGLDANPADKGRGNISRLAGDMGRFKIPSLINVAVTAPYMHDGRFKTLDDVLDHYSGGIQDDPNLAEVLRDTKGKPMKMDIPDNDKKAIIAFLTTLTDYDMITDQKFSNPFKAN